MILIADSGSTQTTWLLLRKGQSDIGIETDGMNPYFITTEKAASLLAKDILPLVFQDKIKEVIFYGAGCSRSTKRDFMAGILQDAFPAARIEVYTDILGAARALLGKEKGVAGILGTGANICYYSGKDIEYILPSLGYILGEEGSGASLGLTLLRAFIRQELPESIREIFISKYKLGVDAIMDAIYHQPHPNRWAASFTYFLSENLHHAFIHDLVLNNFRYFVHKNLMAFSSYTPLPFCFTGSVAYHFQDLLIEAAREKGMHITHIFPSPLPGLKAFHTPEDWQ